MYKKIFEAQIFIGITYQFLSRSLLQLAKRTILRSKTSILIAIDFDSYLIISEPDTAIKYSKMKKVVSEWLAFRMVVWGAKCLENKKRNPSSGIEYEQAPNSLVPMPSCLQFLITCSM